MPQKKGFISYKRDPNSALAMAIKLFLEAHENEVFLDVTTPSPGKLDDIFREEIINRDWFLLLIDEDTFTSNWVIQETLIALEYHPENIVIVAHKGLTPDRVTVPEEIAPIRQFRWIKYDHDYAYESLNRISQAVSLATHTTPPAWLTKILDLTVADCMKHHMVTIRADRTLGEALLLMDASRITYLGVVMQEEGPIIGWLTKGDLIQYLPPYILDDLPTITNQQYSEIIDTRLNKPISSFVALVKPGSPNYPMYPLSGNLNFFEALTRFTEVHSELPLRNFRIRIYPVLDENNYGLGVLGYWMLIEKLVKAEVIPNITVRDCMLKTSDPNYVPIRADEDLSHVKNKATALAWSQLAITDDELNLVGMTTIEKVLQLIDPEITHFNHYPITTGCRPFERCMLLTPDEELKNCIDRFTNDDIGALPVVDKGTRKLVGLLTYVQVLEAIKKHLNQHHLSRV